MQDFFNRFFGGQGGGQGDDGDGGMQGAERRALGSGFIVDPRGYIITNNHVVDKADKIYVKLSTDPDGQAGSEGRPAHVIGVDKDTDIAVIKIDAKDPLPTIKLGNSDGAQVGDWVLAIGSPFNLSKTVTAGIISAKDRSIDDPGPNGISQSQFQRFIQTDASINPGNSGGPLVDMAGQVVGMNTAIYTQSMGSVGLGFAMPSNTIAKIYNMLIGPQHKVVRGSIGISFQPAVSSAVNRMYGFANGVIVSTITPSGGAAKAGLQPGDVIVSIDGREIKGGDDLVDDISARQVGSTVKLGYLRNGKKDVASVVIGDRAKTYADLTGGDDDDSTPRDIRRGPDHARHHRLCHSSSHRFQDWNQQRRHHHQRSSRLLRRRDQSRQRPDYLGNQQEAGDRRGQLQGHRLYPQIQGRCGLCRSLPDPEKYRKLLHRRNIAIEEFPVQKEGADLRRPLFWYHLFPNEDSRNFYP